MPRNMSFALTIAQVNNRRKTVTRRFGWKFVKPGDLVWAVEKGMGLKPGEKIKRLALIRIVSTRWEPLNAITFDDCALEGFPDFYPADFVRMLAEHRGCPENESVNRIEFEYLDLKFIDAQAPEPWFHCRTDVGAYRWGWSTRTGAHWASRDGEPLNLANGQRGEDAANRDYWERLIAA